MLARLLDYFRCDLAVDLGTATTRIGIAGQGLVLEEPSVVALDTRSQRAVSGGCAVGRLAQQMSGRTPESISVVGPLRQSVVCDADLCEVMLRYFLRKVAPRRFLRRLRVVVAVPGCATPVERRALTSSFYRAGAGEVFLIAGAMAAALGAGLPLAEPVASMVCDVGAAKTEIAVLSLGDLAAGTPLRAGGDAMDHAVARYLRRQHSLRIGAGAAEKLRIAIGSAYPLEEEQVEEVGGLDAVSALPRRATITSEEIRYALADPLENLVEAVRSTLDQCAPDLAAELLDRGMVLCGGASLVRGLDRFLSERTGLPVRYAADPASAAARGALVCLEHFHAWKSILQSEVGT